MKIKKHIAVITGDIVNSSLLNENQRATIQERFAELTKKDALLNLKFYRGDSFQVAVKPETALLLALKFRVELKRMNENNDVRVSVGIGEVSTWNEDVLLTEGTAFERSGKKLDELKKKGLRIVITTGRPELDEELETYCYMADSLIKNLTSVQSNVIIHKLEWMLREQIGEVSSTAEGTAATTTLMPQEQIGEILGISQPAVSKTLKAANWKAIERFIKRYKQIIVKNYGTSE
ncbi:MAG: hypothetical protein ACOC1D_01900 [Prolixibacteraceae bacterium]